MAAKKKPSRKKSPSKKKATAKKATAKKATAKKATAKKATAKKATAKKATAKKATRKRAATKRAAVKKTAPSKTTVAIKEDPRIDRLKTLIKLIEKSDLCELAYEDGDIRVNLKQGQVMTALAGAAPTIVSPLTGSAAPVTNTAVDAVANENADDLHIVSSPFVGTFYTSPAPDAAPYTGVGQTVNKGQTVCIVEAMKLMNEIESEVGGLVVEILAENAQAVQYGDPLFKIKVS